MHQAVLFCVSGACACACACAWSSDEGPKPQGGRKAADSTPWTTLGCSRWDRVLQLSLPAGGGGPLLLCNFSRAP
uniref:Secreted protein n=1 Tax=Neovison vison TaxID=452646 RepID=A0A8C7B0E6_NEOVI